MSVVEAGPPDRITAFGLMRLKAASADWNGTISEKTPASRIRRAMSCVNWLPKSMIRTVSGRTVSG